MNKLLISVTSLLGIAFLTSATFAQTPKPTPKVVTAAQVNGVWRSYDDYFYILALGHNKLRVDFEGLYHTIAKSVNTGEMSGEATIEGNVATLISEEFPKCKITMTFLPGKMVVQQGDDDCGFGHNVRSDGTYKRIKAGKPKFPSRP
jgi:hypothetical protein